MAAVDVVVCVKVAIMSGCSVLCELSKQSVAMVGAGHQLHKTLLVISFSLSTSLSDCWYLFLEVFFTFLQVFGVWYLISFNTSC